MSFADFCRRSFLKHNLWPMIYGAFILVMWTYFHRRFFLNQKTSDKKFSIITFTETYIISSLCYSFKILGETSIELKI